MNRITFIIVFILSYSLKSQNLSFLNENFSWPDNNRIITQIPDSLLKENAIIISDAIVLNYTEKSLRRRQSIKILTQEGLNYFSNITLPENFDITRLNNPVYKQGRFSNRFIPYIPSYKIDYFAARIIRKKALINLPINFSTEKVYWIKRDGERIYDYAYTFNFGDLQIGDVLEFTYKAYINGTYDTDQFYINDYFPKLKMDLNVSVSVPSTLKKIKFIKNNNIDSIFFKRTDITKGSNIIQNYNYKFGYLNAVNYTQNILAGKTLAHISTGSCNLSDTLLRYSFTKNKHYYLANYFWYLVPDSLLNKIRVYDRSGSNLRKFTTHFPDKTSDNSSINFLCQLTDTLNSYEYLFAEKMHFGINPQYTLYASERLLKQQLLEEFLNETYTDILFEKGIFYYIANAQDRRMGNHSSSDRAHEAYEIEFLALPVDKSFKFFMPRYRGIKYFPDELPFYLENTKCALIPRNTNTVKYQQGLQDLKFITIPASSYNENVRSEHAVLKINIDSLLIHATIKENLNGQFSTILRHHYNNEYIDSTIETGYFKKCIDKPYAKHPTTHLVSQAKNYPFKAIYNCTADFLISKESIDLTNWFSFLYLKENFAKPIKQDYYFDFTNTDNYDYLFEFDKPIEIKNLNDFDKSFSNDYFELNSKLIKQEGNNYLLHVSSKVKQSILPKKDGHYLIEYIELLNQLNHLKIQYTH